MKLLKNTIGDLLVYRFEKSPNDKSIGWFDNNEIKSITFKEYKNIIKALSLALSTFSLKHQSRIAILSHTRKEWNYIDLSSLAIGAVVIPIYPTYSSEEVDYILKHSESEYLVVENKEQFEKILEIISNLKLVKKIISLEPIEKELSSKLPKNISFINYSDLLNIGINELQSNPDAFVNTIQNVSEDDLATIVYTSGTTGKPKGAVIKQGSLIQVLMNVKKYTHNSIYENDRFLTFLPLSHVLGRCESFFPILFGCQTIYAESINDLFQNIQKAKPTIMVSVPRIFEKIYEKVNKQLEESEIKKQMFKWATDLANNYFEKIENDKTPSSLEIIKYQTSKKLILNKIYEQFGGNIRFFISGGAPLSPEIAKFLRNTNLTVLEGYGLTETIAPCCVNPMNKQVAGTVGQPIGDVQIKFDEDGEILIKSKALFSSYYKDPEETKKVMTDDGWFRSGDIGHFTADGYLKITDRKKDIIITSGGKNVAPQKIENLLKLSPFISNCAIVGDRQKYLTALISIEREAFEAKLEEFEIDPDCHFSEITNHPLVNKLIETEINNFSGELAQFETIKKFKILPIELTIENYLTPSLKLKKKLILKDFTDLIDAMY